MIVVTSKVFRLGALSNPPVAIIDKASGTQTGGEQSYGQSNIGCHIEAVEVNHRIIASLPATVTFVSPRVSGRLVTPFRKIEQYNYAWQERSTGWSTAVEL